MIGGIIVPKCDCPPNKSGENCQISSCEAGLLCYNGACGGTDNAICQCDQENGEAKYHGESCDMPAACDGNPCQNGGKCTSNIEANDTQVCFMINDIIFHFAIVLLCRNEFFSNHI